MSLRIRRGLSNEIPGPQEGELLYTTDTGKLYVGYNDDGSIVPRIVGSTIQDDDNPSLGGNLDLNGNNITGTGNIDINGFINATGSINLGDGAEDNVIVGGVISSSLIPSDDRLYDLGDNLSSWRNGFFEGIEVDGNIQSNTIVINDIYNGDSSIIYDGNQGLMSVDRIQSQVVESDLIGSVFGNDSTTLIDGIDNTISNGILTLNDNIIQTSETMVLDSQNRIYNVFTEGAQPDTSFGIGDYAIVSAVEDYTGLTFISTPSDSTEFSPGDVLSTIVFTAGDESNRNYGATLLGSQVDNNSYTNTYASTKFFVVVFPNEEIPEDFFPEDSNDVARHLTFDGYGRLGVNKENARATVDINGFMLLEPQKEEPYVADDSSIPNGIVAIANGTDWDPLSNGRQSMVVRLGNEWIELAASSL